MLKGYEKLLSEIEKYEKNELSFEEITEIIIGHAAGIGQLLNYRGDFSDKIDNWIEYIYYSYNESDRFKLGLSLAKFIKCTIINEPYPLELPEEDVVVREKGL